MGTTRLYCETRACLDALFSYGTLRNFEFKKYQDTRKILSGALFRFGSEVIKRFSCSSAEHEICPTNKSKKILTAARISLLNTAELEIFLLINMEMPTIVGIFIFISKENSMHSWVEHEKAFITSGRILLKNLSVRTSISLSGILEYSISLLFGLCIRYRK